MPKSRITIDDFRIDYEAFSDELPDDAFPQGADWIMVGPSGPRRLRLAVEHLAQHRGGICFMTDLDPRWVIKLIKRGKIDEAEAYKQHVVEQALTLLRAHDGIRCMFTTPKLLEAICEKISLKKAGITGVFCGGTEMTPQFHRFAVEELLEGAYFAPTYGNTLMGLAVHKPRLAGRQLRGDLLSAGAARHDRSGGPGRAFAHGGIRRDGARAADHADARVFHAALSGARRSGARTALRAISVGRRAQRATVQPVSESGGRGSLLMAALLHVPILRGGAPYRSLDTMRTPHYRTREPFVEISLANVGLIRRDLRHQEETQAILAGVQREGTVSNLLARGGAFRRGRAAAGRSVAVGGGLCAPGLGHHRAAERDGPPEHAEDPHRDGGCGRRGQRPDAQPDPEVFDAGYAGGISYFPRADSLGVVLPSNSPGVHSLWIPAFAMKMPLVLKPGSAEPWTPYRIIQALIQAGAPPQVFGYYPADHAGGGEILRHCGRGMVFGDVVFDAALAERSADRNPRTGLQQDRHRRGLHRRVGEVPRRDGGVDSGKLRPELHQCVGRVGAAARGGDRRGSGAAAGQGGPARRGDEQAQLAPFADAGCAGRIAKMIDADLDGERRASTSPRRTARATASRSYDGCSYLLPTIVLCDSRSMRWPTASSCSRMPAWCRCARRTSRARWVRAWWSRRSRKIAA